MIVIHGIDKVAEKITIKYDPMSDFMLAMDLLSAPKHQPIHTKWAESVINSLSRKYKTLLFEYKKLFNNYLHMDEYLSDIQSDEIFPIDSFSDHLKNLDNWKKAEDFYNPKEIISYLVYMWETYIYPVVIDHKSAIIKQIEYGRSLLPNNYIKLLTGINERITINKNILKMQKWYEMDVTHSNITIFRISPLIFVFPYLVMDWDANGGNFYLGWETPFKGNDSAAKGIEILSAKAFALSDKSRLRMLLVLKNRYMTQKELGEHMGFAKSTTSKHVNILLDADILIREEVDKTIYLKVNEESLNNLSTDIKKWLNQ